MRRRISASASSWVGSRPSALAKTPRPTSGSGTPLPVTAGTSTSTSWSSLKARFQARSLAPPVVISVPSMSNSTAWASATLPPVPADQAVGGRVMVGLGLIRRLQLGNDLHRQLLAELDSPLIEGVDPPDRALREDAVLVEGDQGAQCVRREAVGQDHVRGT